MFAAKCVRGAYMVQESRLAREKVRNWRDLVCFVRHNIKACIYMKFMDIVQSMYVEIDCSQSGIGIGKWACFPSLENIIFPSIFLVLTCTVSTCCPL